MTTRSKYPSSRVHVGQEFFSIVSTTDEFTGARDDSFIMALNCNALVIHYYLVSGTNVQLEFYTGSKDRERLVGSATLATPSTELTTARLEELAGNIRCRVVTTGDAQLEVRIMGAHSNKAESGTSPDDSALVVVNPTITNVTLAFADTESAIALPANTKRFILQARGNSQLQVAYAVGQSGINYWTVYPGGSMIEEDINRPATTIYVQSSKAGEVIEVKSWS